MKIVEIGGEETNPKIIGREQSQLVKGKGREREQGQGRGRGKRAPKIQKIPSLSSGFPDRF
jgi:hypothetical protein